MENELIKDLIIDWVAKFDALSTPRDPKRINIILRIIAAHWSTQPDLRLGQIIANAIGDERLFFIEDDELIELIHNFFTEL